MNMSNRNPAHLLRPHHTSPSVPRNGVRRRPATPEWGLTMDVSRREFLRYAARAGAGTALGGITGLGLALTPARATAQDIRIKGSKAVPSICPFCSVGCATLIHVKDGEIINIEGDSRSPHNEGTLCPKGAAIYQLHKNV